jgi:anti-anti-sigma factor
MSDSTVTVEMQEIAGQLTLVLHGEFDVATISSLTQALNSASEQSPSHVTIDLRDAAFFGLAALDTVLAADAALAARGSGLDIVNATPSVAKMMTAVEAGHLLAECDPARTDHGWTRSLVTTVFLT